MLRRSAAVMPNPQTMYGMAGHAATQEPKCAAAAVALLDVMPSPPSLRGRVAAVHATSGMGLFWASTCPSREARSLLSYHSAEALVMSGPIVLIQ